MKHNLTLKQNNRFLKFLSMNDVQFYDTYIDRLPEEAQMRFFQETPDFLSDIIGGTSIIDLTTDRIYQQLMRQIHDIEQSSSYPKRVSKI